MSNMDNENKNLENANAQNAETDRLLEAFGDENFRVITEETRKMKFGERIAALFFSPVKLMQNIRDYPVVWQPLVVIILLGIVLSAVTPLITPIQMEEQSMYYLEHYGVDLFGSAQTNAVLDQLGPVVAIGSFFGVVGGICFSMVVSSLILLLVTKILRGKAKFQQYFSMYAHTAVIGMIGSILWYTISYFTGSMVNMTSLAAVVMPTGSMFDPLFLMLSGVSLFTIWVAILEILGIREINGFGTARAVIAEVIMFAGSLGVIAVTAMVSSAVINWQMTTLMGGM